MVIHEEVLGQVACCLGCRAEECWQLAPTHLEAHWDDNHWFLSWFSWEDIAKVPGIIGMDDEMPKTIFNVPFCKKNGTIFGCSASHCSNEPW